MDILKGISGKNGKAQNCLGKLNQFGTPLWKSLMVFQVTPNLFKGNFLVCCLLTPMKPYFDNFGLF